MASCGKGPSSLAMELARFHPGSACMAWYVSRNLGHFQVYCALVSLSTLCMGVVLQNHVSWIFLKGTMMVACVYFMQLQAGSEWMVMRKIYGPLQILSLLVIMTVIEAIHLKMASYGTVQRPSTIASSAFTEPARPRPGSDRRVPSGFSLLRSFNIPSSAEAAAVRIIRNLGYFQVLYILLLWSILFMSLVPRRRVSLIFLVATTAVSCLYLLLLQAVPDSVVLHKIIDRRLVLALLMIVTIVELVLTCATIHLLVSLAIGVPIILVHAVLRSQDDLFVNEQASAAGELVPLVDKKDSDLEPLV